jgi:LuxR family maltose regulon positive regulatory protein
MAQVLAPARAAARPPAARSAAGEGADPAPAGRLRPASEHGGLLVRQRLLDEVDLGVEGPLTLVSAPAGSGKTVLLDTWSALDRSGRPVVRAVLQAGDERPARFWSRVLDAVRDSGLEPSPTAVPDQGAVPPAHQVARAVRAAGTPVVLVLDGADRLAGEVGDDLSDLLEACGGDLRLVLVCRSDPGLPLHLYRLHGSVTEVRADSLAFTEDETAQLVRLLGLDLRAAEVTRLHACCRGWAGGLRLAAVELEHEDPATVVKDLGRDGGDVSRYLASQVLDTHPAAVRELLLRSSVADRLDAGLLAELTGSPEAQQDLERLLHGNVLVERLPDGRGHRYHPLFAQLLRARLAVEHPGDVTRLHLAAASWAVRNGHLLESAGYCAAAGAWSDAAGHLVDDLGVGALLRGPDHERLSTLFRAMPSDETGAAAAVVRAALAVGVGDLDGCRDELDRATAALAGEPEGRRRGVEIAVTALRALLAEGRGDVDGALECATETQELLSSARRSAVFSHPELASLAHACRGRMLLRRGELLAARTELGEAAVLAEQAPSDVLLAEALGAGALVEAVNGRLRRALDLAHRARAVPADVAEAGRGAAGAAAALAWVRMDQYDLAAVPPLLEEARRLLARADAPMTAAVLAVVDARYERATGDLDAARARLHGLSTDPGPAAWLAERAAAAELAVLVAMGRAAPEQLPRPPVVEPAGTTPLELRVEDLLVRADRALQAERPSRALLTLARALRLAAPEHMRRPFHEAGPGLRRLLGPGSELAARHPWLGDGARRTATPQAGSSEDRGTPPPRACADGTVVVEPLTAKEREVLGHLAQLLTTEEIAATMFVSVNTVRTHVRSVLRKLSATRRNEAVRRAWELQILPRRSDEPPGSGQPLA